MDTFPIGIDAPCLYNLFVLQFKFQVTNKFILQLYIVNKVKCSNDCLRDIFISPPDIFISLPDGVKLLPQLREQLVDFELGVVLNLRGGLGRPRRFSGGPWGGASTGSGRRAIESNMSCCSSTGFLPFGAALRNVGLIELFNGSDGIRTVGGIHLAFSGRLGRRRGLVFDAGMMTTCK